MAITVLQTANAVAIGKLAPSITINFDNPTSANSLIVVGFSNVSDYSVTDGAVSPGTITDNNSNSYTSAIEIDGGGDGDGCTQVLYLFNAGSGITEITLSPGIQVGGAHPAYTFLGGSASATAWEVSTTSAQSLDKTASNEDTGAGASISPGTFSLSNSVEFVVAVCSTGINGNNVLGADSPFDVNFTSPGGQWDGYSYIVSSSSGPYTPNFDLDSGGVGALAVAATFEGSGGSPAFVPQVSAFIVGL